MKKGRIFTVHFGDNVESTKKFINNISTFLSSSLELIIVNNSKEIDFDFTLPKFTYLINSNQNLGYFGGVKLGIEKFPIDECDYIIVCNNDIEIVTSDFLEILNEKLNLYDIVAPSIKTINGIEQNPHLFKPISKFRKLFYKLYFLNFYTALLLSKLIRLKKNFKKNIYVIPREQEVFSPHGSFIVLSKSYFNRGGQIDDGYFLYGEENSIAAQASFLNLKTGFVPELKIKHWESITTEKGLSRKKFNYQKNAYKYIKDKYPDFT